MEEELIFRRIAEKMGDAVYVCDQDRAFIYANPAFEELAGFKCEDIKGRTVDETLKFAGDAGKHLEDVKKSLKHNASIADAPARLITSEDELADVLYSVEPLIENSDSCAIVTLKDMSGQVLGKARVERAATEWRITFDSIRDLISIHDNEMRIIRMNKAFAETFDSTPKDLLGKTCYDLMNGKTETFLDHPIKKVFQSGVPETFEIYEGSLGVYFEISVSPVYNRRAEVTGCVHVAKDITGRKEAEKALREAQQQLLQSEKMSVVGRFASGVAHEIRNPLANIVAASQFCLSKKDEVPASVRDYLGIILRNAENANDIIKDLLDFARPRKVNLKKGDVSRVIQRVCDSVRPRSEKQEIMVDCSRGESLPDVFLDESQLEAALLNFATNSLDAMPYGGKLSMKAIYDQQKNCVLIKIRDTGEGIPEDSQDKIFEPFFTTKDDGVGLGMSLVHQIIEAHNGKVNLESRLGGFTEFTVELPAAES